jgi:DNA polymerase III epsilon subunit-like protein
VLDTVALYPHPRGLPYKSSLRHLARSFLRRTIQDGEHDSAVDATAAMDLVLLKVEKGPSFGLPDAKILHRDRLPDVLANSGRRTSSCLVDRRDTVNRHLTGVTVVL